jgi:arylsulfatase A-like enzyme
MKAAQRLTGACAILVLCLGLTSVTAAPPEPGARNVLLIVIDDIGNDTFEDYLSDPLMPIPKLQTLADEGVRFTSVWSNPLCSPTRATILSGLYGFRTGVRRNAHITALGGDVRTIAEALRDYSEPYDTGAFGKWHLNALADRTRCDVGPYAQGFDFYKGSYENLQCGEMYEHTQGPFSTCGWGSDYWNYLRTTCSESGSSCGATEDPSCTSFDPTATQDWDWQWEHTLVRDDNYGNPELHATEETTADALSWINGIAAETPWFAYVAYNAAHAPWQPVPPAEGGPPCNSSDDVCKTLSHRRLTEHLDSRIGDLHDRILNDPGLAENTVIIVVGDNGTPGFIDSPDVLTQRGAKGNVYEAGVNVPLIVWTPETQAAAIDGYPRLSSAPVNTTDLFATVLELATGNPIESFPAEDRPVDSVSLRPIIEGSTATVRDYIYADSAKQAALRDEHWKLIVATDPVKPTEFFKLDPPGITFPLGELYDLLPITESSPGPRRNAFGRLCRAIAELNPELDTDDDGIADECCDASAWTIDGDGDGVLDVCDPCPNGPFNEEDLDGDGVPESCDTCPFFYNPDQSQDDCFGLLF